MALPFKPNGASSSAHNVISEESDPCNDDTSTEKTMTQSDLIAALSSEECMTQSDTFHTKWKSLLHYNCKEAATW